MRKTYILAAILFSLAAIGASKKRYTGPTAEPVSSPTEVPQNPSVPGNGNVPAERRIQFSPVVFYKAQELEVLEIATRLSNEVTASSCFKNFMAKRSLVQTGGLTNQEVITKVSTTKLTVPVQMYYQNNGVIGYRNPPKPTIYTNRKFHAGASACARASNLTHEWSHVLGFKHDFKRTKRRPFSVPYSIGAAFEICCSCKGIKDCTVSP